MLPDGPLQERVVKQGMLMAPPEAEVRAQLEKILASPAFDATVKMQKFLRFVTEMTVTGRADELKAYTIGTEVYGRGSDFDPAEDTIVRIQAGRLRRALDMYYLTDGKNDRVRIDIPKGTYVPTFFSHSDLTEGLTEAGSLVPHRAVLSRTEPSIAVLPFANLTGDSAHDYFAAGFTEEITIELTHYEDFHVIGCRPPAGLTEMSDQALKKLGARFLVEGSLRMRDRLLRVGIKLTDTTTGELLWGEQYQCNLSAAHLVDLQEKISKEMVARIAGEFGIIPTSLSLESRSKAPKELSSYEAMLRCYYFHRVLSPAAFRDAFVSLQSSIEREPDFAMTLAMLADLYLTSYSLDNPGIEQPLKRGAELAERAVALNPMNQFIQFTVARLHFIHNDRESFLSAAERALSLNPHSSLRTGAIGFYLCLFGEWERGMALLEDSMQLNQTFPNWFYGPIVLSHYRRNDYARAYEEAAKYSMPNNFWGPMLRAATLGQLNRAEDARSECATLFALRPDFRERGGELIRRYVKEEHLVRHIVEGLNKAGLELEAS